MAHFAQVIDGVVVQVIVISDDDAPNPAPENSEPAGQDFIANVLNLKGEWLQTSYSGSFRANYAGRGSTYDAENDVFIGMKPFTSWVLNDQWDWEPPVALPEDHETVLYNWDDDSISWVAQ